MTEAVIESASQQASFPFVFVVGCPRSGTTLLQRMLNAHPMLTVANDTHFIPRALKGFSAEKNPSLTDDLVQRVKSYHRFKRFGVPETAVTRAASGAGSYSEFVRALYVELARSRDKPLAGEKTPDYVRHIPLLHSLFPEAKIIHIIRDGRDVALSTLEWAQEKKGPGRLQLWKKEPLGVCALWWSWLVEIGRCDGRNVGTDYYHEVHYEHLVGQPEKELQRISEFLDLPHSSEMLAYHQGKMRSNPKLSAKSAWLPPTPGLRDWRSQMEERDIELFEALAGELLTQLGYERITSRPSVEIGRRAAWCRRGWVEEKAGRRGQCQL